MGQRKNVQMKLSELITAVSIFGLYEANNANVTMGDYCIYAGSIESCINMTEYECHLLEKAGWSWDDLLQCFRHFI